MIQYLTSKVVYVPLPSRKDPDELVFKRIGVRVELSTGEYWFHMFRTGTYTRHIPGRPITDWAGNVQYDQRTGELLVRPESKESYGNWKIVKRTFKHCYPLLDSIEDGIQAALDAEAEKRNS